MKKPAGRGTQEVCATSAEVIAAIESLSAEEFHRLKKFAGFRIRGLGRAAMGRDYSALLSEAVVSTLQGSEGGLEGRKWAKNRVRFINHLLGAMRSISSHWKEAFERRGTEAEQLDWMQTTEDEDGNVLRPSENLADARVDPYRSCAAKEVLDALDNHFAAERRSRRLGGKWCGAR